MSKKNHYKVVFILGAAIEKDANGNFVMAKSDIGGPLLGEWRLRAAQKLWKMEMVDKFVIVSHIQKNLNVWRCEVMRDILVKKYEMDPSVLVARRQKEDSTDGNAKEILEYLEEKSVKMEDCAFLTNFYHIPRACIILQEKNLILKPIAAESFFVDEEVEIRKDYGQIELTFFDRLIKELKGMKVREIEEREEDYKVFSGKKRKNDRWRILYGAFLVFVGCFLMNNTFGIITIMSDYKLFIWILAWSFLSLGIYALLFGIFWAEKEEELLKSSRKYFRYVAFQFVASALVSVWLIWANLTIASQYLAGVGFGIFFGVWIHTIYQGIDNLRDNIKIP